MRSTDKFRRSAEGLNHLSHLKAGFDKHGCKKNIYARGIACRMAAVLGEPYVAEVEHKHTYPGV